MSDIFKIVKLQIKIFNMRFNIKKSINILSFYGIILAVLGGIQLFFINFGQYEKMYVFKIQLLPIFFASSIFPDYDLQGKYRLKSFFGSIKQKSIDSYYCYKNYLLTISFMIYILFPYKCTLIKTFLFCILLWLLLYLVILILRIYFKLYNINLIRLFLIALIIYQVSATDMVVDLSPVANGINIFIYLAFILLEVVLSLKLLRKFALIYSSKSKYLNVLLKTKVNKYLGYNFLYLLRNSDFAKHIYIFYINYICVVLSQKQVGASIVFVAILTITDFVFLHSLWKVEQARFNFLFSSQYRKRVVLLKYWDLLKCYAIYLLFVAPAIVYKLGLLSLKLFGISFVSIMIFNLCEFVLICRNNYRIDKTRIKIGVFMAIVIIVLQIILI